MRTSAEGQPTASPTLPPATRERLEAVAREHATLGGQLGRRARGVLLILSGVEAPEITARLGVCGDTVERWRRAIDTAGPLGALERRPGSGRQKVSAAERARRAYGAPAYALVPVDDIRPDYAPIRGPSQSPEEEQEDAELRGSISRVGILKPLVVSRLPGRRTDYRLADGARRYKAAQELGLRAVPCQIYRSLTRADFELLRWDSQHGWRWKEDPATSHG